MCKRAHCFTRREIPQADGSVERGCDDLGLRARLASQIRDRLSMPAEHVHIAACSHIPDSGYTVAAAGYEHVEGRV